ncbi:MAG: hypothetical protein KatS3mg050_4986 [Litorilinea sp.]|nr:MAG: hypothetical protein KatS3mg050_4986 [Litorilinea sp.]
MYLSPMVGRLWRGAGAGLLAALCGLAVPRVDGLQPPPSTQLLLGITSGVTFALLFGRRARGPGAGLIWGVAYGFFGWLLILPMLGAAGWHFPGGEPFPGTPQPGPEFARAMLPLLLHFILYYGGLVGLFYTGSATWLSWKGFPAMARGLRASVGSALMGGIAGWIGGLAFGAWMAQVGMFPLIAGLVGSQSPETGRSLHFLISVIIGASYGLLFRPDVRGLGASIAWGITYGFIWWIAGGLTLLPWWSGSGVDWSLAAVQQGFGSLVGHLVYGVLLGVIYAAIDRLVRLLFTESDPLYRDPEGPGTRSLRALAIGAAGSVAGGLLFSLIMVETGTLPQVASLIGQSAPAVGFLVHMAISTVIGASYGLLFWREGATYGDSMTWGLLYGFTWWVLGPLTLMPILLGGSVQWTLAAGLAAYPSLVGHLAYGGATGLLSHHLIQRHRVPPRPRTEQLPASRTDTPVPALWAFALGMGVLLPLLLAG